MDNPRTIENKIQRKPSLDLTRKNKLFPQYPVRKFNVFFKLSYDYQKTLLSGSEVIFHVLDNNFL